MQRVERLDIENPFGGVVYFKERTASTMEDAASLEAPGHGTVICAAFQEAGRGRGKGRSWFSLPGESLLLTLVLKEERLGHPPLRIPLLTGLALCLYLEEELGLDAQLKWPNDVLLDKKKIAGILCQQGAGFLSIGLGLNCLQRDFPPEIGKKASSLFLKGVVLAPLEVLSPLLSYLSKTLERRDWKEEAQKYLYALGEWVELSEGAAGTSHRERVLIRGLGEEGFLIVEDSLGRTRQIMAGEI